MADYHPIISRAVAALETNNAENRRAIYEHARATLLRQLRAITPALKETEILRERLALEDAIRRIELEYLRRENAGTAPLRQSYASYEEPPRSRVAHSQQLDQSPVTSASFRKWLPKFERESIEPIPRWLHRKDSVEFGISHPHGVVSGAFFVVDAWIYHHEDRTEVIRRAQLAFKSGGSGAITRGSQVTVKLEIGPWKVDPPSQTIVWAGEIVSVPFAISPTNQVPSGTVIGRCSFFMKGLRIGQVLFELSLARTVHKGRHVVPGRSIGSAFASYASRDRRAVIARVQGIEKLGVEVFMDVRNLKSGDPYPVHLLHQIDSSDVLYLFWSLHAKHSIWVEKEWRYGLERKGIEFIDPVPLVDPRKVSPPAELGARINFNDWTLAYLEYENSIGLWRRFRSRYGI
jgi:hypothetical protein